jgi:hypothetical protein
MIDGIRPTPARKKKRPPMRRLAHPWPLCSGKNDQSVVSDDPMGRTRLRGIAREFE